MRRILIRKPFHTRAAPRGYLMIMALVFGSIFVTVLGALAGFAVTQNHVQFRTTGDAKALALAEEGLEYYRWHLSHFPTDLQNGTGHSGPYVIDEQDPEGGDAGTVSLAISGNSSCGQITSVDIAATGKPNDGSGASKTVTARYSQPSVANYSYILNDSVWAGADRIINGPYHSNGGIRMDGTTNAPVTSSLSSWLCTSDFGCSPNATKNGVFGSGSNSNFWSYPSPQVDFAGIAADFSGLKTKATNNGGIVLARYSSGSSGNASYYRGYHLIFNSNGTVTIKKVSATASLTVTPINASDPTTDHTVITSESTYQTKTIPSSCGLIFVEDNAWIEGTIPSKVTVVVANVTTTGVTPSAMLPDNITYSGTDAGLTVIAQNDVLITGDSPNNMTLNGIFIAQNGAFGRNYFGNSCNGTYEPRGTLTIHGTTVSNKRTGTKWQNGCGNGSSDAGYQSRTDAYDRTLATDPPPFTPTTSTDYQFTDWREE